MLETMETKQKESQTENDSCVKELMEKLTVMEMALTMEKIKQHRPRPKNLQKRIEGKRRTE
jgi:hypothetical protein